MSGWPDDQIQVMRPHCNCFPVLNHMGSGADEWFTDDDLLGQQIIQIMGINPAKELKKINRKVS